MRLFIAIDLTENIKQNIKEIQDELKKTPANLNIVKPEKTHITLKFLGDIEGKRVPEIEKILDKTTKNREKIPIQIEGMGAFPGLDYIQVIWIGTNKGTEKIKGIHKQIEKNVVEKNLAQKEKHDFTPHITIARMNGAKGKKQVQNIIENNKTKNIGQIEASKIKLKKSTLTSQGPKYDTIYTANLK